MAESITGVAAIIFFREYNNLNALLCKNRNLLHVKISDMDFILGLGLPVSSCNRSSITARPAVISMCFELLCNLINPNKSAENKMQKLIINKGVITCLFFLKYQAMAKSRWEKSN